MKTADERFQECDALIDAFEKVTKHPIVKKSKAYYVGVDLGTACVVVVVLDETYRPVAGAYQYADVVRDGMVVGIALCRRCNPAGNGDAGLGRDQERGSGSRI